jgi:phosphatidylserine decarboxylase
MNVGSFSTAWAGELVTSPNGTISRNFFAPDNKPPTFKQGDYLGHFNLGSTVVFIAPPVHLSWDKEFTAGATVRMGQRLGQLTSPAIA